jgi:hypothetical protein
MYPILSHRQGPIPVMFIMLGPDIVSFLTQALGLALI